MIIIDIIMWCLIGAIGLFLIFIPEIMELQDKGHFDRVDKKE